MSVQAAFKGPHCARVQMYVCEALFNGYENKLHHIRVHCTHFEEMGSLFI